MNTLRTNSLRSVVVSAALLVSSFIFLVTVALPANNLTYSAFQNFGHFALFAILGFLVLQQLCGLFRKNIALAVFVSAVSLLVLGLAVEWFQSGLASRTASVNDFLLDVGGIIGGFFAYWSHRLWRSGQRTWSLLLALVVALGGFFAFKPTLGLIGFDVFRPALPVVRGFDHPFSVAKLDSVGGALIERVPVAQAVGSTEKALRVVFAAQRYSGVVFYESSLAWSNYKGIRLDIFNRLPDTRQIELRINDRLHNNLYKDRYNASISIMPGLNRIEIPLTSVINMGESESPDRKMNIDDISQIQLFADRSANSFTLDVLRIELF